ncbi:MAG: hypothetical protein ABIU86_02025, partial [Gemmatimonadaceae bacterium]
MRDARRRAVVHIVVLALSCLALPLSIRLNGDPPPGSAGILWLLALLTASLGAPFVMLASGTPIIQRWLADSGHPDSANPYFLYAASNLGSLVALLCYPVFVEPTLRLSTQRAIWSAGYLALIGLTIACALIMSRDGSPGTAYRPLEAASRISPLDRAQWVLYSAVPASLLVGVTTFISTDVAPVPLLWVLPLSIYLLTFVFVFATHPPVRHWLMTRVEPHVLVIISIPIFWGLRLSGLIGIVAHLIVLYVVAMVCHGELARRRPPPAQLTEFFVWVAAGGLIGGVFNAFVAPIAFNGVYEYPTVLALAAMLSVTGDKSRFRTADVMIPAAFAICLLIVSLRLEAPPGKPALLVTIVLGAAVFSFRDRPLRFGLALAFVFVTGHVRERFGTNQAAILDAERSFFGVYRVSRDAGADIVTLYHGTTLHGAQSILPGRRLEPLTYYHRSGPSGDVFALTRAAQ